MATFVLQMAHSLMLRLVLLLVAMGGLIIAVLFVSWLVFQTIDVQMASLKSEQMPELRGSKRVVAATDATRALLTSSLTARSPEQIDKQTEAAEQIFSSFRMSIESLPGSVGDSMMPTLERAESAVAQLQRARTREFAEIAAMVEAIRSASEDASVAGALIEEANDSALFDMTLSGEETIALIDETLTRLVEEDFNQFQAALSIRGEINLATGLAIAFSEDGQSQIRSIVADLASSSMDRLSNLLEQNEYSPALKEVLPALRQALALFRGVFEEGSATPTSSDVLAARLAVDTVLSPALDDIYFSLIVANDDAKQTNRAALSRLLEDDVEGMRVNSSLDAATKHFLALLLQLSSAQSIAELDLKQRELAAQADDVARLKAGTAFENQGNLASLLRLADPETGLGVKRAAVFDAQATALAASQEAAKAVDAIAKDTSRFSESALQKIEQAAAILDGTVEKARARLAQIGYFALMIMVVVPILLWKYVTRPIGRVTAVTERLAEGDLSEIQGLPLNQGELGRMASALHVFRESALKTIEMREEERRRERAALEAEKLAEEKRREDDRRQAEAAVRQQKEEHAREAKLAAEAEKRQRAEIAERTARMEEQAHVVTTLAQGLSNLAAGDLTCEIHGEFPAAYEALRLDFNSAIQKLAEIVVQLKGSSEMIEGSCIEIASASDDLTAQTEKNASTLANTVSSVGTLSSSVASAAKSAGVASVTIQGVREMTKLNNDVMTEAKSTMGRVEAASEKITSIVDIIDSIAFQTNLLALNAGVEAARAGSAGQGFAVVANEVRTLAQRCGEAANEIGEVVEESNNTVQEGVSLTVKANDAMSAINDGIDQISTVVDDIANSAAQQAGGLEDVNLALQNLDKSTQQNATMFEETSAATKLLSSEAQALSGVVKSFVLHHSEPDRLKLHRLQRTA